MPNAEPSPPQDLPTFLAAVRAAGVLHPAQLERLNSGLPPTVTDAVRAAHWLIAESILTRFQAERLLAGKTEGLVLDGYVILEPIGQSAGGRVFKAWHRPMNRMAAVKIVASQFTRTDDDRRALHQEVQAAARLTHPNVVTVWDVNNFGPRFYLVREYVEGASADLIVKQAGPMPVSVASEVIRQAALGLQHAHEKNLPHGAVMPSNLLVALKPGHTTVKVTNFVLGRLAGNTHANSAVASTEPDPADYRAPERSDANSAPTPAGDLYSLGCILYFLLAGEPPFQGGTAAEKVNRHRSEAPPEIELIRPEVPAGVASVIRRLLGKTPESRPASAAEVAGLLAMFSESTAASSGRWPIPATMGPPSGRLVPQIPTPKAVSPWAGIDDEPAPATVEDSAQPTPLNTPKVPRTYAANAPSEDGLPQALLIGVVAGIVIATMVAGWFLIRLVERMAGSG